MPRDCAGPGTCKRGQCIHGNVCLVHCAICSKKKRPVGPSTHRRLKIHRTATPTSLQDSQPSPSDEQVDDVGARIEDLDPVCQVRQLCYYLSIPEEKLRKLPSLEFRHCVDAEESIRTGGQRGQTLFKRMLSFGETLLRQVCAVVCPNYADTFLSRIVEKMMNRRHEKSISFSKVATETVTLIGKMTNAATSRSVERRVLLASLASKFSKRDLSNMEGDAAVQLNHTVFKAAKVDSERLLDGKPLIVHKKTRARFNLDVLKDALRFFLSEDSVCVLSWGTKQVKLSAYETVELPSLTRKKSLIALVEEYLEWQMDIDPPPKKIAQASAFRILTNITNGQKRALSAVKDLLGELILDNFVLVQRIINLYTHDDTQDQSTRRKLRLYSKLVANFLKNQYPAHAILEDDDCCSHGTKYGLTRSREEPARLDMNCDGCKFVLFFFDELRTSVAQFFESGRADGIENVDKNHVLDSIQSCEAKTKLWRGQCIRVANQQREIYMLHKKLIDDCVQKSQTFPEEAIVIMDFKMKYLPQYYRQKSIEHFGKRGTSWHGFLVVFYTYNSTTGKADREHVYCDQILSGTNKQDGLAIAGLVEAFLLQLKETPFFSELQRVTIQSDNAAYYHSNYLIVSLPYTGVAAGVDVVRYIHTETCDGKGLIDAHFAMGMRYVDAYIGKGNNATGPFEVFKALTDRAIPNTFIQLVTINRQMLESRESNYAQLLKGLKCIGRSNEIQYKFDREIEKSSITSEQAFGLEHQLQLYSWLFSGIDNPNCFVINPVAQTVQKQNQEIMETFDDDESESDEEEIEALEQNLFSDGEFGEDRNAPTDTVSESEMLSFGAAIVDCSLLNRLRHEERHTFERLRLHRRATTEDPEVDDVSRDVDSMLELVGALPENEIESAEDDTAQVVNPDLPSTDPNPRRDLVACAVRLTREILEEGELCTAPRNGKIDQPEYALARDMDLNVGSRLTEPGWAKRPKRGHTVGSTEITHYLQAIGEMFASEGSDKQHPSWFRTRLQHDPRTLHRLDHPTESEVRNVVARCIGYRTRCREYNNRRDVAAEEIVPNYVDYLVLNISQIPGRGIGGPRSQLPNDQEEFIQAHAADLPAKRCMELALQTLAGAQESLSTPEARKKFMKRVTNVRSKNGIVGGGGQNGGPRSQLPNDQEEFIQAHAADLPAKRCMELALQTLAGAQESLSTPEARKKFMKRVTNVRSKLG